MNDKIIKICEQKFIYLNYSFRTKEMYIHHISQFLKTIGDKQIIHCNSKVFQNYLDDYKFTSISQQNQVINAIRFLYKYGLEKKYDKVSFQRIKNMILQEIYTELNNGNYSVVENEIKKLNKKYRDGIAVSASSHVLQLQF